MTDAGTAENSSFLDLSLQKADNIERALIHLAKAIELDLVDVTLDPTIASNGNRERYAQLGSKLAQLSGISYELMADIAAATGIAIEQSDEGAPELEAPAAQPALPDHSTASEASAAPEPEAEAASSKPTTPPATPAPSAEAKVAAPPTAEASGETKPSGSELFEKIIDLVHIPEMRPVDPEEAINIEICGNSVVKIKGHEISLSANEVFILNGLLMLRDKPRSSSEIRALGFEPTGKTPPATAFANAMKPLIGKLNNTAGKEIIKKLGERRNTQYAFNPRAVLEDVRIPGQETTGDADVSKKN